MFDGFRGSRVNSPSLALRASETVSLPQAQAHQP